MIAALILLSISLSIDSLGMGITYGIRKIKIPLTAQCIITLLSVCFSTAALCFGSWLCTYLPPMVSKLIGVCMLFGMGVWIIMQSLHEDKKEQKKKDNKILDLFIKPLGITIQIIRNPAQGDLDKNNCIEPIEAVYLGIALSIDSFGAGIAMVASGASSLLLPVLVALFQLAFLLSGDFLGRKMANLQKIKSNIWSFLSGILMILIACLRLL